MALRASGEPSITPANRLYRSVAIDRLSSPEQIDGLLDVTPALAWLGLLVMGLIVSGFVAWGLLGTLTDEVEAQGVVLRSGAITPLVATRAGVLSDVRITIGDSVGRGDVVATYTASPGLPPALRAVGEGRVVDVRVAPGSPVSAGDTVLLLEPEDAPFQAIAYLPLQKGKTVLPGMRVQVTPATVRREEFGAIIGIVTRVAPFAASNGDLLTTLGNSNLVAQVQSVTGPAALEVRVALVEDARTPTGLAWTSGQGPVVSLSSGTPMTATIAVSEQHPIGRVIPMLAGSTQPATGE